MTGGTHPPTLPFDLYASNSVWEDLDGDIELLSVQYEWGKSGFCGPKAFFKMASSK
jgi:hypothetical protein